jgi:hypothetical protein
VTTETILLDNFSGIDLSISANVTLHQGPVQEVKVTAASNIIENLQRDVKNGVWDIKFEDCVRKTGKMEIDITLPSLKSARISGSGDIEGSDLFEGENSLELDITGSGDISLNVNAVNVSADIAGSGDITLATQATAVKSNISGSGKLNFSGNCTSNDATISGSGNLNAFDLLAETADIRISGSGNANISVSNSLIARISGSGDINYKGTPTVDADISGSGRISHVD